MVELSTILLTTFGIAALFAVFNNSFHNQKPKPTKPTTSMPTTIHNRLPPQGDCGIQTFKPNIDSTLLAKISPKIINGDPTVDNSWPWMVSIRLIQNKDGNGLRFSGHYCSGSLVYRNYILTTAHCFNKKNFSDSDLVVIGGKSALSDPISPMDVYSVNKLIIHPHYNSSTVQNDIAFIKLDNPVALSDRVALICLPTPDLTAYPYNKEIVGVGWGRTTIGPNDPTADSNELKQTILKCINGDPVCDSHPKYDASLMYCVLGTRNGSNFCWGKK
jgi:hypothetical protein